MDFGRLHCYYWQPNVTQTHFAYLAIYLLLITRQDGDRGRVNQRAVHHTFLRFEQPRICVFFNDFGERGKI
jgi:hypothetical protein